MPAVLVEYEIKLFAGLRTAAGAKSVIITGPDRLFVAEMLKIFTESHPKLKAMVWSEDGKFSGSILILINGKDIRRLSGLDTQVNPGDKIEIFPPVSGG
jgi:sulfur-carrier protein